MGKLISVIIPVYNVERYLPICLESVCNQTYDNLEIVLIDDGSIDNSGQICDIWAERDNRIVVIHKENGGVSAARNDGLEKARGELIGFVDSDDWIEPDMYEKLYSAIGGTDMVCCGYVDYPLGTINAPAAKGIKPYEPCEMIEAAKHIYERDGYFTSLWNKLFRRDVLIADGSIIHMDSSLSWGEDEVWLAQVLCNCRTISFVPEALYHWRPTQNSATRNEVITDRQMTLFKAKKRALTLLPRDKSLRDLVKARMFNDCFSMKVTAYASKDWEKFNTISRILSIARPSWMKSPDSAPIRKFKVLLMEMEMKLHLPGRMVQWTDNVRRYGIKK